MKINIDTNKISNLTYRVNEDISLNISFANNEMTIEEVNAISTQQNDSEYNNEVDWEKMKDDVKKTDKALRDIQHRKDIKEKFVTCINHKVTPCTERYEQFKNIGDALKKYAMSEDKTIIPHSDDASWQKTKYLMEQREQRLLNPEVLHKVTNTQEFETATTHHE